MCRAARHEQRHHKEKARGKLEEGMDTTSNRSCRKVWRNGEGGEGGNEDEQNVKA